MQIHFSNSNEDVKIKTYIYRCNNNLLPITVVDEKNLKKKFYVITFLLLLRRLKKIEEVSLDN